jgi:serine/threonine protein kinase
MEKKTSKIDAMIGRIFFNKYTLVKKLGEGSFGAIYAAKSLHNWYAIKLENKNRGQNLLENEAYIMSYLHGKRIPFIKSFGYSGDYNVLVMELMGKSLEEIFENLPIKKMTVNCVGKLGLQMIEILEYIHNKHIIHRDIKPDNFVMGKGEKSKYLYLLDFGLAKKYRSSSTLKHYPMIKKKNLTGTARYASINALNGLTQSRRDDLEAVGYVLLYFLRGKLPWQGLHVKNKEDRYHKIMEIKMGTSPYQLCKGFPKEFEEYVDYTRNLEYEKDPDYKYLKGLFNSILKEDKNNSENIYDWDLGNKTLNTITTNNTSQKAFLVKDKDKNKKDNILFENNNNFIDMQNILDNEINEFEEKINIQKKEKNDENKLSMKAIHTNEGFYNSQVVHHSDIKKFAFNTEENLNTLTKDKNKENEKDKEKEKEKEKENDKEDDKEDDIIDLEYEDIMEMTDEGKEEEIKKKPNVSGFIHSKRQLEKNIHLRNIQDTQDTQEIQDSNHCVII